MLGLNQLIERVAAAEVNLLADLPGAGGKISSLTEYLQIIFPLFIQIASLLAILVIAYNGLKYIFSKLPGGKGDAKEHIMAAVGGLILALAAYLILHEINPDLTKNQFEIPGGAGNPDNGGGEHYGSEG